MDKTLVCRECGASFVFTQGEQDFYQSRGLANPPSRCPKCRAARRAQQASAGTGTAAAPASRPPDSRPMYPATCARCGQPTQVPFQPRGDRPVYCSSCFHVERTASPAPSYASTPTTPRPSYSARPSFVDLAPIEEPRRERRHRKPEQRAERGDRVRYNRRSRDYWYDEEDEEYEG